MAVNLSHKRSRQVGAFYSPIHRQIADESESQLPPSVVELRDWLAAQGVPEPGTAVLDAGCGAHALNSRIAKGAGYDVVSLDLNADAVAAARDRGLHAVRGSVLALPSGDDRYALVLCSGVAHHTPDPWLALRELHRVLRPGGALYLTLYCFARSPAEWMVRAVRLAGRVVPFEVAFRLGRRSAVINNFVLDHAYVPLLWLFTAREIHEYLRSIGFDVEDSRPGLGLPDSRFWRTLAGDGLLRQFMCRKRASR